MSSPTTYALKDWRGEPLRRRGTVPVWAMVREGGVNRSHLVPYSRPGNFTDGYTLCGRVAEGPSGPEAPLCAHCSRILAQRYVEHTP